MHHFIYPEQDTFVTNTPGFQNLNFGLDEILRIGNQITSVTYQTPVTRSMQWNVSSCSLWSNWDIIWNKIYTASFVNTTTSSFFLNRSLVQFDITSISASVASGDIELPQFTLKMKVAREMNLPIKYNIYALPISESWNMGNGYVSDGGSQYGTSWMFRDYNNGTPWATPGVTCVPSLSCTQSFNYQIGDVYMDVTPIAMAWISGSIPNNGLLLINSDEFQLTGSNMALRFFSKDTNTIYEPVLDVAWNDFSFSTGSITTSSINFATASTGALLEVVGSSSLGTASVSGPLWGTFCGIGNVNISSSISSSYTSSYASGVVSFIGTHGLITSMSIVGNFSGSLSQSIVWVDKKCQTCKPIYGWQDCGRDFDYTPSFFPNAGDDASYNVGGNNNMEAFAYLSDLAARETFDVIDGQFPSMYFPAPNIPGFIQAGLWYMTPPAGYKSCGTCPPGGQDQTQYNGLDIYGWGHPFNTFNQYDWWSQGVYQDEFGWGQAHLACEWPRQVTMSLIQGQLIDGLFSGSTFTSSFFCKYIFGNGFLMGNWNSAMLDGEMISGSFPFQPQYPEAVYVYITGSYINGGAFGSFTNVTQSIVNDLTGSSSGSGIFQGVIISGPFRGRKIYLPFEGFLSTTSSYYTSSINYTSMSLSPVDTQVPFTAIVQNIPATVKAGDMMKIKVFGRPQFPLKNFIRQTQFTQFLIPQYLPTSSYYAIKDNETEEIILDFDSYTQLSCDANGNYFILDTTSFPQERYYKILLRVEDGTTIYSFDEGKTFKIVR